MKKYNLLLTGVSLFALLNITAMAEAETVHAQLSGYQEVPAVSTGAAGEFRAKISEFEETITYELSYEGLESDVLMAHIHFGQAGVNGGISVWLCTTPAAPAAAPPGTQICPQEGVISGTITAADVVGPATQGIAPGELEELIEAIRARVTYANVHTTVFPGGEIRGRIR